jgi:hypothetical protein
MLDDKENAWLERLENEIDKAWPGLNAWEQKFMEDILEDFRKYGRRMFLSPKQWAAIARVSEKII